MHDGALQALCAGTIAQLLTCSMRHVVAGYGHLLGDAREPRVGLLRPGMLPPNLLVSGQPGARRGHTPSRIQIQALRVPDVRLRIEMGCLVWGGPATLVPMLQAREQQERLQSIGLQHRPRHLHQGQHNTAQSPYI